ncbi:major facilitator superfamily domain-containing protein [Neurospora tetraspora]|uniref:Major facilitator superfamily domain-containing protein n=1 Tax=Neurospora tetraspora TaxID=94610 RepID=A0AAE0JJV1_9PEZI|nr:major facilitator superfamily domain-containing protein [Neurospora tetraspora]
MADTAREAGSPPSTASEHGQYPEKGTVQSSQLAASDTASSRSEPRPHLHAKTFLAVFAICVIYFVQIYNVVGSGAQTNTIAITLGNGSTAGGVWLSSSIAIGTAVLSPIFSQSADYWGRRWFLVLSTLIGAVGSIIVARATSMNMAIAGFAITSISYGAQPLLHAVSSEVLPRRYRSWGQAADLVANGLGGVTALLCSGAFSRTSNVPSEGFRNYWYLGTGLFLLATVLCFVFYNPPQTERERSFSFSEKLGKLDWVGYFLLTSGIVLFCIGLSWSENPFPWSDAHVSATFGVGMALIIALAVYETFFKKDGMFHHGLFKNRNFPIVLVCLFCEGLAFFGANNYFAFQVGILYESDALLVSTRYSIAMFVSLFSAVATGMYCAHYKRVRWITVASFCIFVAFFACMSTSGVGTNNEVWGYPVLLGTALGMSLCVLVTVAQLSTPPELIAIASGLVIGLRSLGGSVGLAIYNALLNGAMGHLGDNIAKAVLPLGLPPQSVGPLIGALADHHEELIPKIEGVTPQIIGAGVEALKETFATGFRRVWIAASCFVALAAILACFLKEEGKEFNMRIDNPIEKEEELYSDVERAHA